MESPSKKIIIDRIEGIYAVCEKEDRTMINIPISAFPVKVNEGEVWITDGGNLIFDYTETENRKKDMAEISKRKWH
ncbi:DUF3006 domain-containing protein [Acetobacterium sp.]|uniref:DUF3006 domain-containing protein n=1 Tax=Acetobacterium sp. TaxID=1872094 RepID=UPI003593897C